MLDSSFYNNDNKDNNSHISIVPYFRGAHLSCLNTDMLADRQTESAILWFWEMKDKAKVSDRVRRM